MVYFVVNLSGTLLTMNRSPLYYGLGMTLAGILMYLVGLTRLLAYVSNIDYHIFCGQPVLMVHKEHWLGKIAARLDTRVNKLNKTIPKQAEKEEKQR